MVNDMDAQNATAADQSKSATAPRRRASDADSRRPSKAADRRLSASPEAKSARGAAVTASSKPETAEIEADERDSDAETIVLPGKDGHSPSKIRKMKQEDKNDNEGVGLKLTKVPTGNGTEKSSVDGKPRDGIQSRRLSASAPLDKSQLTRTKDGSSGLSSAPASPPRDHRAIHRRRRSNASPHRSSDSEAAANRSKPPHDRLKSSDRPPLAKRKAPRTDSDDEDDHRKARRQRTTSISLEATRTQRDKPSEPRNRSNSPPARLHRRSASTQLAPSSSSGLSQKKRRLPPPLQSTEHHSDDSDRSGSPLPRSSKLRSLATPATADSNVSPAKIIPHKKHLDAHGQTFLARACARGEYDAVKKRLGERPEDINVADYAGNTPLQIAAINGCEDIVKLLIDAGCNMDCVNYDKDTPLLDAVDNGHLEVVKLLLDAGVNPRKANVSGQEPIDRITDETENADEIRTLLLEARKRAGERRRTSEDRHSHADYYETRDSHAPDSPRHSPATALPGATGRRSGTVRATKTRNDLLYMPLDDKTLRQAAGRGDEETVARILQVKEGCNDPESMVAAARGGHDLVIQLLLGLGSANPDPGPVPSLQPEFATPILAAIGQENIKVVELLLEQGGFDPTRRFKGETYYEIARKRQGTNWKEEETLLKNAYDEYKRAHKDGKPGKSPGRREREREEKRARRDDVPSRDEARAHKRNHSSPTRDVDAKKKASHGTSSSKERRKLEPGRHVKDDRPSSTHTSDRETSPAVSHRATKSKYRDTDAAMSSDGEALKPRRKLVSKGELRGERDKHRRSSMASNASSLKEPSSPQDSRNDDTALDKTKMSEKYHDRTKALKREEIKDPSGSSGDNHPKRHRSSVTPDGNNHLDKEEGVIPQKRRRIDADDQGKRLKVPTSPETRHSKLSASRDGSKPASKASRKSIEDDSQRDAKDGEPKRDRNRKEPGRATATENSVRVKSEEDDVSMPDVESTDALVTREQDKRKKKSIELDTSKEEQERQRAAEAKKDEERRRLEAKREEDRKQVEAEEKRKREEAEEVSRREVAEKARLAKEEQRLEEEKRKKDEAERQRQEDERKRQEEEKRRLEDARKRREEEERSRLEQLEREAAEAARRKREEEQRKERERRERAQREELERKRAAREAEQRRVREEQEKARLDKLPPLMRWLDLHPNPKTQAVAERFSQVQGCRYDTIDSATNGTAEGREEWVLNTAVALLLGEKDLTLSRCKLAHGIIGILLTS